MGRIEKVGDLTALTAFYLLARVQWESETPHPQLLLLVAAAEAGSPSPNRPYRGAPVSPVLPMPPLIPGDL